jgi:hypothetical protein
VIEEQKPPEQPVEPRLHIRREAEQQQEFHYSREERLARPDAPKKREPEKGFFRRNRRLIILFGNIVLLFVLVVVLQRRVSPAGGTARIGEFSLTLQGLRFEDTVYATVTVKDLGRRQRTAPEPGGRISVRFTLEPAGEAYLQSAALPRAPGEEVVVGEAIPLAADQTEVRELQAEVSLGGEARTLRRTIKQ